MRAGIPQFSASRIWLIYRGGPAVFVVATDSSGGFTAGKCQSANHRLHDARRAGRREPLPYRCKVWCFVQALVTANNIANANQIFVAASDTRHRSAAAPSQQPSACARTHTVVAGETLSGIAVKLLSNNPKPGPGEQYIGNLVRLYRSEPVHPLFRH